MTVFKFKTGDILLYGEHAVFKVYECFEDSYILIVIKAANPVIVGETRIYKNTLAESICDKYFPNYNNIWWKLNET